MHHYKNRNISSVHSQICAQEFACLQCQRFIWQNIDSNINFKYRKRFLELLPHVSLGHAAAMMSVFGQLLQEKTFSFHA